MRLIDADALKEEVNKKNVVGRFNTLLLIDNAPVVEAVPLEFHEKVLDNSTRELFECQAELERVRSEKRSQSEWVQREEIFDDEETSRLVWGCKGCGFSLKSIHDKRNYCPNCGAKMRCKERK